MPLSAEQNLIVRISAQNAAGAVLGQVNRQFGDLAGTVTKVAAAIASAFAVRDVLDATQRMTHDIDALTDAMGLSGTQASRWNYQARYVGITADDLATSFQILANNVYGQADAIAKGTSDFDKLGVSVLNAQHQIKPMDELLAGLRERMRQLDAPSQAVLERQLFGRAGGRLHDFLLLTDQDVARLNDDLNALGMTLGTNAIVALEQQQRELNRLGFIFDSLKLKLGQALIPLFISLANVLQRASSQIKAWAEALRVPLQIIKEVGDRVQGFLADIGKGDLWKVVVDLGKDVIKKISEGLHGAGDWVNENWPAWRIALGQLWDNAIEFIRGTAWPQLVDAVEANVPRFGDWIVKSLPTWTANLTALVADFIQWWLAHGLPTIVEGFGAGTEKIGQWLLDAIGWMSHIGIPAALSTLDAVGGAIFKGIADGLGDLKTVIWNWIKDAIPGARAIEDMLRGGAAPAPSPGPGGAWIGAPKVRPVAIPESPLAVLPRDIQAGLSGSVAQFFAGIPGVTFAASGFSGVVSRPHLFMVGEGGSENVSISPLGSGGSVGGGITVNVTVMGSVTSEGDLARTVSDYIMRAVRGQRNFSLA